MGRQPNILFRSTVQAAAICLALLVGGLLPHRGAVQAVRSHADFHPLTTVTYAPTTANFANPERGFYHHTETHSNAYEPLTPTDLQDYRQNEQISLILRVFYLDDFVESPISQSYLDGMTADFGALRQAGLKAVVRFAYTSQLAFAPHSDWPPIPPYGDASKAQVLAHLQQLAPILQANSDVIALVQTGFIGVWGEWYYTDHFVADPADPSTVSDAFHAQRGEVLAALLAALPGRMAQVRTPLFKQKIYGTGSGEANALPPANAFDGSDRARTGHHNDCFLSSDTDFGTYSDVDEDRAFLAAETRYLPMGGESCNETTDDDDPQTPENESSDRSLCPTALAELAEFHWSYLNADYHPGVLASWAEGGCLETVKRRLGYRFALIEGSYPDTVPAGGAMDIQIDLRNEGWAAPYNPRPVDLVLRHVTSGAVQRFSLAADPRLWLADGAGRHTISQRISVPSNLPSGEYALFLALPDPILATRPEYAIRLANAGVWQEAEGWNNLLHTLTVTAPESFLRYLPTLLR